jgi:hypothetical protein
MEKNIHMKINLTMETIRFTTFMDKSKKFRIQLIQYGMNSKDDAEKIRGYLGLLNKIETESQNNTVLRNEFYKWLNNEQGYSTIKLRKICRKVGYDYWDSLKITNIIDTFDTVSCINRN